MTAKWTWAAAGAAALAAALVSQAARAQQGPSVSRAVVQRHDLRAPGEEGVMALVEIPPGGREGRHTHPAEAFVYVVDGAITFDRDGAPSANYKAGDTFFIAAGEVHEAINKGTVPAKLVAVFVADKGKPLTTQVK